MRRPDLREMFAGLIHGIGRDIREFPHAEAGNVSLFAGLSIIPMVIFSLALALTTAARCQRRRSCRPPPIPLR
jgi:hypothetical protein